MKKIHLDYGTKGLEIELPDDRTTVVEPNYPKGVTNPSAVLSNALNSPIGSKVLDEIIGKKSGQPRVAIAVCDGTRPQPRELMLRALFEAVPSLSPKNVVILVATGTHRANTKDELRAMLGDEVVSRYRVINHDARDTSNLKFMGNTSRDIPVWLNREWVESDVRVTTGFVEPHFFAGFSGGPKLVAPGLAGLKTTMVLHDARHVGDSRATWGVTEGNPIHDDVREIAKMTGVDFAFDVTLNGNKEITAAFAGELFSEHQRACQNSKDEAMREVARPFDVVITTNSGFPLDQNLYQSIKGMSAAAKVAKPGGVIICATECRDGLPEHGAYADLLKRRNSPEELLEMVHEPGFAEPDQWQVQVQAQIQKRFRVMVKTNFITAEVLRSAHFEPVDDIAEVAIALINEAGGQGELCVLPRGPQTVPYIGILDQ